MGLLSQKEEKIKKFHQSKPNKEYDVLGPLCPSNSLGDQYNYDIRFEIYGLIYIYYHVCLDFILAFF